MSDIIDKLADEAFQAGATDLFLCEDQVPRIRVNNAIQVLSVSGPPALTHQCLSQFWQACHADPETTMEKDTSHVISGPGGLAQQL